MTYFATTTPAATRIQIRNDRNKVIDSLRIPTDSTPEAFLVSMGWTVAELGEGVWKLSR
jgi:hypothetical protein